MEDDNDIQWTILRCPICKYTTPELLMLCPHDGALMRAIPEDENFGVAWKELQERISTRLDQIDAFHLLKLETDHDCTKEQLARLLEMQRDYQAGFYLPADRSFIKRT